MSANELVEKINGITNTKYIKKDTREHIKSELEKIIDHVDENEQKQINTLITIMEKSDINAADRRKIKQLRTSMINTIRKYEEYYNDECNEDNIDENLTVNEIEAILDNKIPEYNKFNETHPMKGITWEKTSNRYKIQHNNLKSHAKNLYAACNKIIENSGYENTEIFGNNIPKHSFDQRGYYFICYQKDNKFYFDIQHIISVLNLKKSSWNDKYNEFSDDIEYYMWHQNEFGGYILRELISEETMYRLVLSSNSVFSKSFKRDVAKILAELRQKGKLEITNKKVRLSKNARTDKSHVKILDNDDYIVYSYDNPRHAQFIRHLTKLGSQLSLSKFANKHVLYAFIIPLKLDHNDIIIKFGYTEDIFDRIKTLQSDYKCKPYLIKAKIITGQSDEKKFHNILKTKYSGLKEIYRVDKKDKIELYKFSPILMKEYNDYMNNNSENDEITNYVNLEIDLNASILDTKSYYKYITMKEKNYHNRYLKEHEKFMSESETNLTKLRYKYIDKEIELAKIQSQIPPHVKSFTNTNRTYHNTTRKSKPNKSKFIEEESSELGSLSCDSNYKSQDKPNKSNKKSKKKNQNVLKL